MFSLSSDDLVFVITSITCKRVGFGDVDRDDTCSKEFLCLCDFVYQAAHYLPIHFSNCLDKEVVNVFTMAVAYMPSFVASVNHALQTYFCYGSNFPIISDSCTCRSQ